MLANHSQPATNRYEMVLIDLPKYENAYSSVGGIRPYVYSLMIVQASSD